MSDHLFEPWKRLIKIVVRGKLLEVPENNLLLRQLSFVAPDIASGKYAERRVPYCDMSTAADRMARCFRRCPAA